MINNGLSETRKIAYASIILALAIVFTVIAKLFSIPGFPFLRFSLAPALLLFSSLTLGPLYGGLIGFLSDLIPAFIYPTGAYNFLISFVYLLFGVLAYLLLLLVRKFSKTFSIPYPFIAVLLFSFLLLVVIFYGTDWLDSSFGEASYWAKPLVLALSFIVDMGLYLGVYFYGRKKGKESFSLLYRLSFIASFSDLLILDFLKALAFYLYYTYILAGGSFLGYGVYLSMIVVGTPINVFLMIFINSLMFFEPGIAKRLKLERVL